METHSLNTSIYRPLIWYTSSILDYPINSANCETEIRSPSNSAQQEFENCNKNYTLCGSQCV